MLLSWHGRAAAGLGGAIALLTVAAGASAGPDWTETGGGAGSLPTTAETPTANPVRTISGELKGSFLRGGQSPDFEDMYRIYICDPLNFSARTDGGDLNGVSTATFNTQLWLFREDGRGLLGNDDSPAMGPGTTETGSLLRAPSTDGVTPIIPGPGFYYLAISGFNDRPVSAGGLMFDIANPMEISGPDGPGGTLPITGWLGPGEIGTYTIALTGVCPTPGCGVVFAMGGVFLARRRR